MPEKLHKLEWAEQLELIKAAHSKDAQACGLITKLVAFRPEDYGKLVDYINNNEVKVIHLYRENVVEQAFSKYMAVELYKKKKKFNIYSDNDRLGKINVNLGEFMEHLLYTSELERRLFTLVRQINDSVYVSFEFLINYPLLTLTRMQKYLEVPGKVDILEPTKKIVNKPLSEIIKNYDEVEHLLSQTLTNYCVLKDKKMNLYEGYYVKA
jgi:hypothetical protein